MIGDDATDKRQDESQDKRQKEIKAFLGFFQKHYFSGKEERKHFAKIPEKDGDEEEEATGSAQVTFSLKIEVNFLLLFSSFKP